MLDQIFDDMAVTPSLEVVSDETPMAFLEGQYERYLRTERGLTTATVINYLPYVRRFLVERFGGGELGSGHESFPYRPSFSSLTESRSSQALPVWLGRESSQIVPPRRGEDVVRVRYDEIA